MKLARALAISAHILTLLGVGYLCARVSVSTSHSLAATSEDVREAMNALRRSLDDDVRALQSDLEALASAMDTNGATLSGMSTSNQVDALGLGLAGVLQGILQRLEAVESAVADIPELHAAVLLAHGEVEDLAKSTKAMDRTLSGIESEGVNVAMTVGTIEGEMEQMLADLSGINRSVSAIESNTAWLDSKLSKIETTLGWIETRLGLR